MHSSKSGSSSSKSSSCNNSRWRTAYVDFNSYNVVKSALCYVWGRAARIKKSMEARGVKNSVCVCVCVVVVAAAAAVVVVEITMVAVVVVVVVVVVMEEEH